MRGFGNARALRMARLRSELTKGGGMSGCTHCLTSDILHPTFLERSVTTSIPRICGQERFELAHDRIFPIMYHVEASKPAHARDICNTERQRLDEGRSPTAILQEKPHNKARTHSMISPPTLRPHHASCSPRQHSLGSRTQGPPHSHGW